MIKTVKTQRMCALIVLLSILCLLIEIKLQFSIENKISTPMDIPLNNRNEGKGAVLILGCNRPQNLNLSLYSLSKCHIETKSLPIFISLDCRHNETIRIANNWIIKMREININLTLLLSNSIDIREGNLLYRIKNHWLSAINRMFVEYNMDFLLYLEDDHIVSLDIIQTTYNLFNYVTMHHYTINGTSFFAVPLARHLGGNPHSKQFGLGSYSIKSDPYLYSKVFLMNGSSNMAVMYFRKQWMKFMQSVDIFCETRNGWDGTLHTMLRDVPSLPSYSLFLLKPRAIHLRGSCFSSRLGRSAAGNLELCYPNTTINEEYKRFIQSFDYKYMNGNYSKQIIFNGIRFRRHPGHFAKVINPPEKQRCLKAISFNTTQHTLPPSLPYPQLLLTPSPRSSSCLNEIYEEIFVISIASRQKTFALTSYQLNTENIHFKYWEGHSILDSDSLIKWHKMRNIINSTLNNTKTNNFLFHSNSIYMNRNIFFLRETQIDIIKYAKKHNLKKILLLEDDIILSNTEWIETFCEIEQYLPEWLILNIGVNQDGQPTLININNHKQIKYFHLNGGSWGAFAVSFSFPIYQILIDLFTIDISESHSRSSSFYFNPFDSWWQITNYAKRYNKTYANMMYGIYPDIIIADVTSSDLRTPADKMKQQQHFMKKNKLNMSQFSKYWNVRF